jgi:ubiquinone/menaquinone biosynthesis C-methylase UbiE
MVSQAELTERQKREIAYHREHGKHVPAAPSLEILNGGSRWWNAYWHTYEYLRSLDLSGKNALVLGCGFGNDAIFLYELGARVWACDVSRQMLDGAIVRTLGREVHYSEMPAENLSYGDSFFDLILAVDIFHHVDVPLVLAELRRVARPGAWLVWDEIYCHTAISRIRHSMFGRSAHRLLSGWVYGTDRPYITEDEVPLSEREIGKLLATVSNKQIDYFNFLVGRLFPDRFDFICKADRILLSLLGPLGSILACRCVGHGTFR